MRHFADIARSRVTAPSLGLLVFICIANASRAGGVAIHPMPMVASPNNEPRALAVRADANSTAASNRTLPAPVLEALLRASPFPSAEIRGSHYRTSGNCNAASAELSSPLVASGEIALRISGTDSRGNDCTVYAFVDVRVTAEVLVAAKPIREGAALEGSVRQVRREIAREEKIRIFSIPDGVLASRSLAMGQLIESSHFREPGLNPGAAVRVRVQAGALSLEEEGQVARCPGGDVDRACAVVASGKRVEGLYRDGVLLVVSP